MTMENIPHRTFILEKILVTTRREVPKWLARKTEYSERDVVDEIVYELKSYMLAENRETVSIHEAWPRDWWQAVRERWFPQWWLVRWPVQYKEIDIEQKIYGPVCPHLTLPEIDHEPTMNHLQWMTQRENDDGRAQAEVSSSVRGAHDGGDAG